MLKAVFIAVFLLLILAPVAIGIYTNRCANPARLGFDLAMKVRRLEIDQLSKFGVPGDLEGLLLQEGYLPHSDYNPNTIFLEEYRIETRNTGVGWEIVLKPKSWCFCRPTYLIVNQGQLIKRVGGL